MNKMGRSVFRGVASRMIFFNDEPFLCNEIASPMKKRMFILCTFCFQSMVILALFDRV